MAGAFVGEAEVVDRLEVEPELTAGAEPMAEAQGGIAGDDAASVDDLADAVGRDNLEDEFSGIMPMVDVHR